MSTARALTSFTAVLTVVFAGAVGLGRAVGPIGPVSATTHETHPAAVPELPAGLAVTQDGYTLELAQAAVSPGPAALTFRVTRPGVPVTSYVPTHERDLHLVVVRRDLTAFRHVHPTLGTDGTWSVTVALPEPGAYKVLADFRPHGASSKVVLATDLTVTGAATSRPLPAPSRNTTVDGYVVTLEGDLTAGTESALTLTVSKDGRVVRPQPYLGALGHLVALRTGDLAYLHVHPDGLRFVVDVPTAGDYRLFLDFRHDGVVRTAAFTASAS